ncbi:hypothetical protein EWM64_g10185 [Hericium alpestre]|uniref:Uncharacterized protein n=1 Tax=Hericium alpestre TaxID=135208 RepID=A0A4Y9ZIH5_9AGAM|nr:hypothetical protein EWM64_g10185 [Hericium alpestre]
MITRTFKKNEKREPDHHLACVCFLLGQEPEQATSPEHDDSVMACRKAWPKAALCLAIVAVEQALFKLLPLEERPLNLRQSKSWIFSAGNWGAAAIHYMKVINALSDQKWQGIMELAEQTSAGKGKRLPEVEANVLDPAGLRRIALLDYLSPDEET